MNITTLAVIHLFLLCISLQAKNELRVITHSASFELSRAATTSDDVVKGTVQSDAQVDRLLTDELGDSAAKKTQPSNERSRNKKRSAAEKEEKEEKEEKNEKNEKGDEQMKSMTNRELILHCVCLSSKLLDLHISECSLNYIPLEAPFIPPEA